MGYVREVKDSFAGRKIAVAREKAFKSVDKSKKRSKSKRRERIDAAGNSLVNALEGQRTSFQRGSSKKTITKSEKKAFTKAKKAKISNLVKAQEGTLNF